jgi:hypothetical protein
VTWKLTVRAGSQVEHERLETLEEAIFAARTRLLELAPTARRETTHAFVREIPPGEQVAARLELRGPKRARGGVDLRGDGTSAAWTGLISKRALEPSGGEDALSALARALGRS